MRQPLGDRLHDLPQRAGGRERVLNANLRIGENTEAYATLLVSDNRTESTAARASGRPTSTALSGFIWDDTAAEPLQLYQHIFSPEEVGGRNRNNEINKSLSYNVALGLNGVFGESEWEYDAYYARSQFEVDNRQRWPLTEPIEDFFRDQFLGPQLGTYYGYPVYHPDPAAFYQSVTPEQFDSFNDTIATDSETWTHSLNFRVTNTNLFEMPAGPVGAAILAQVGKQSWDNPTDPRVIAGEFWGINGTQGGRRARKLGDCTRVPRAARQHADGEYLRAIRRLQERRCRQRFEDHVQARPGIPAGRIGAGPRQLRYGFPRAGHGVRLRRRKRLLHDRRRLFPLRRSRPAARELRVRRLQHGGRAARAIRT